MNVGRFWRSDDGRISVFLAIALLGVLVVIGLSADGAGRLRAAQRADHIAAEAARAGGQAIVLAQAVTGGGKIVDPARAVAAASAHLAAAGVDGQVEVGADQVTLVVTVSATYETLMLGLIGIDRVTVVGRATAHLVTG
jgi:Flp pilus assembly protein TadG